MKPSESEIEKAKQILNNAGYFFPTMWTLNDIIIRGKDLGFKISKIKAMTIAEEITRRHDCTIGFNWDVMDEIILEKVDIQ